MIAKINNRGHSFKGVTAYLAHDKKAQTNERVGWSATGNLHTDDIEKAALVMAWTDKNADALKRDFGVSASGRKTESGAVYHYSLSWANGEEPEQAHQQAQAIATIERLGLSEHQYFMVGHTDTDHAHVHVVVNLTHPETGKRHSPSFDKRELQKWALDYEREHGLHCEKRLENAQSREQDNAQNYYKDKKQHYSIKINRAYAASDNGQSFKNALELEGLQLAKGRKWLVVVDDRGDIQNLSRIIEGQKTKDIKQKLGDIDREKLQNADVLSKDIKQRLQQEQAGYDRDTEETEQQKKLLDAADNAAQEKIKADQQSEKLFQLMRTEILKQAKLDWQNIKERQLNEKTELEQQLRNTDSPKEAVHRKYWTTIINTEKDRKSDLEAQLNEKGIKGFTFRLIHGQETREEIAGIDKNIEHATQYLNSGVGGLSKRDRHTLYNQGQRHKEERDALKNKIDQDLKNAKETSYGIVKKPSEVNLKIAIMLEKNVYGEFRNAALKPANIHTNQGKDQKNSSEAQELFNRQAEPPKNEEHVKTESNSNQAQEITQSTVAEAQNEPTQASDDWHSENAVSNDNQNVAEQSTNSFSTNHETWEEIQEIFSERYEEIQNNPDYTEEQRQEALYELEVEYFDAQSEYDYSNEENKEQGIEM